MIDRQESLHPDPLRQGSKNPASDKSGGPGHHVTILFHTTCLPAKSLHDKGRMTPEHENFPLQKD
jgi:hypothetical protein